MKKVIELGKFNYWGNGKKIHLVTIELELKQTEKNQLRFTACCDVWNSRHTDIIMGGQAFEELMSIDDLKNNKTLKEVFRLWNLYHLNDMHAGSPEQEQAVEKYFKSINERYEYTKAVEYLKSINLHEVTLKDGSSYKYGHGWLYQEIPNEDLLIIKELLK